MASIDKATAELRWPGYTVTGDGRLAVVCHCNRRVVLASTPLEAAVIQQERCGQHCSHVIAPEGGWHQIKKLDRAVPKYTEVFVSRIWEE